MDGRDKPGHDELIQCHMLLSVHRRHRSASKARCRRCSSRSAPPLAAIGLGAAREHVDAAIHAELVEEGARLEEIFAQVFVAGAELKALGRLRKLECDPFLGADRAVPCGGSVERSLVRSKRTVEQWQPAILLGTSIPSPPHMRVRVTIRFFGWSQVCFRHRSLRFIPVCGVSPRV